MNEDRPANSYKIRFTMRRPKRQHVTTPVSMLKNELAEGSGLAELQSQPGLVRLLVTDGQTSLQAAIVMTPHKAAELAANLLKVAELAESKRSIVQPPSPIVKP